LNRQIWPRSDSSTVLTMVSVVDFPIARSPPLLIIYSLSKQVAVPVNHVHATYFATVIFLCFLLLLCSVAGLVRVESVDLTNVMSLCQLSAFHILGLISVKFDR
jgi:hypothetical protein